MMQLRFTITNSKQGTTNKPKALLKRLWATAAALAFLVLALFLFSVFFALFCAAVVAALIFGLWLKPVFDQRDKGKVIEAEYEAIDNESNEAYKKPTKSGESPCRRG